MTAIVGWIDDNEKNVWLAADSAASDDSTIQSRVDPKVFKIGPYLIAGAGSFRCIQLLMFDSVGSRKKLSDLKLPRGKSDLFQFMVTKFVPCMRSILVDNGAVNPASGQEDLFEGDFLVGVRGRLFGIHYNFHVGEYDKFTACGSGYHLCLGALKACHDHGFSAEDAITTALDSAAHFSNSVQKPYLILNNK